MDFYGLCVCLYTFRIFTNPSITPTNYDTTNYLYSMNNP